MYPERRRELLLFKDGVTSLPQLRVNGVYVGDGETVQELEDFGELDEVLEVRCNAQWAHGPIWMSYYNGSEESCCSSDLFDLPG